MAEPANAFMRFWTPDHEAKFQQFMAFDPSVRQWRNAFQKQYGESPRIDDDPTYNYRNAFLVGNAPQPVANDTVPHWGSDGKAADHPTAWKARFMDRFGVDPDAVEKWTPDMTAFLTREMRGVNLMGDQ